MPSTMTFDHSNIMLWFKPDPKNLDYPLCDKLGNLVISTSFGNGAKRLVFWQGYFGK